MFSTLNSFRWRTWLSALFVLIVPTLAWGQQPEAPTAEPPATPTTPYGESGDAPAAPPTREAAPGDDATLTACFASFSEAQRLRHDGKLLDTRQALLACANDRCPPAIVQKCIGWLGEVTRELPSMVVWAKDRAGRDTTDVRVWIDGKKVADRLDGRPLELDPGAHQVVLEHQGEQKNVPVLLATGEKNRRVGVSFAVAPPPAPTAFGPAPQPLPPPAEGSYRISPLVWVGLSLAVVGGVVAGVTGGMALSRANDLEKRCPGKTCTDDERADYDEGARLAHTSTAFIVVASVGAALGVVGILLSGREDGELRTTLGPDGLWLRGSF